MPETGLAIGALTDHRGVGSFIHHLVHFTGIADLDLEQPAVMRCVWCDRGQIIQQGFIDFGDFAAGRAVNVGRCLHGFEHGNGITLGNGGASFRELNKDNIAKLFDSVWRYSN